MSLIIAYIGKKGCVMASNSTGDKNETLSREELIKKLQHVECVVIPGKERIIQGQNRTIQTLTAQNLLFRELLKKVLELKTGLFGRDKFVELQKIIRDKLNSVVIKNQASSTEILTEQNLILSDLIEQFLNMEIGLFNIGKIKNFQQTVRTAFDELRGRHR